MSSSDALFGIGAGWFIRMLVFVGLGLAFLFGFVWFWTLVRRDEDEAKKEEDA